MAASGHGRRVVGASEKGQALVCGGVNHLIKGVVGMAAGRVYVCRSNMSYMVAGILPFFDCHSESITFESIR